MDERDAGQWGDVLRSAARLQELVPDAVLVGGTAAALHARRRTTWTGSSSASTAGWTAAGRTGTSWQRHAPTWGRR